MASVFAQVLLLEAFFELEHHQVTLSFDLLVDHVFVIEVFHVDGSQGTIMDTFEGSLCLGLIQRLGAHLNITKLLLLISDDLA